MRVLLGAFAVLAVATFAAADTADTWLTPPRVGDGDVPWNDLGPGRVTILPAGEDETALALLARRKLVALDRAAILYLPAPPKHLAVAITLFS